MNEKQRRGDTHTHFPSVPQYKNNTGQRCKAVLCFSLSVILGAVSVTDKHHSLFLLAAPSLSAAALRLRLTPTGVMLGQLCSLVFPEARWLTGLLLLIWAWPFAFPAKVRARRQLSPLMLFLLCALWEGGRFVLRPDGGTLLIGLCGAVLSACALYFLTFFRSGDKHSGKVFVAELMLSLFALMLSDSTFLDGALPLSAAVLMILICSRKRLWQCLLEGSLISLAAALISRQWEALPMLLAAVAAVSAMQKWGKRICSAAVVLCGLLALLPAGVFLEHPFWLLCAPAAGGIFLFLPLPTPPSREESLPLSAQYEALVRRVDKLQQSARRRITFHPEIAERASLLLRQAGAMNISVTAAEDLLGGFFLDLTFSGSTLTESALLGLMERAAGFALSPRRCFLRETDSCASFVRRAPFTVQCAALCKTKEGETVCGDNALAFSADQSHYVLLLSDGMGSGKEAFAQSCWTLTLLQKLLRAGVRAEGALGMVHSSLRLANEDVAFATADLCSIDLFTGKARFIKAGALSSFILRGDRIIEVSAVSMPLGATEHPDMAATTHSLKEGDLILLISDGAYERKDQLLFALQKHRTESTDTLARRLMAAVLTKEKAPDDDITVLIARLIKNS